MTILSDISDDLKNPFILLSLGFGFVCLVSRIWNDPYTLLHHVVSFGQLNIVKILLKWGISADVKKHKSMAPLCVAAKYGYRDIALILIENGADINEGLYEESGWNPLIEAAIYNNEEMIEILTAIGAKKVHILLQLEAI